MWVFNYTLLLLLQVEISGLCWRKEKEGLLKNPRKTCLSFELNGLVNDSIVFELKLSTSRFFGCGKFLSTCPFGRFSIFFLICH